MKISIIIVNYNGSRNTKECLRSLEKIPKTSEKVNIIVIDNGSAVSDLELLKQGIKNEVLVCNRDNIGFAAANNLGIKQAILKGADFCLLLNNDVIVDKDFLSPLVKLINNNPNIGIVSPKIFFYPGYEFHQNHYAVKNRGRIIWYAGGLMDWENINASHRGVDEVDSNQYSEQQSTAFATGCCMLFRLQLIKQIGYFDNKYFLYWEDMDFCERAKRRGWQIYYEPQSIIWHKNASSSEGAGGKTSVYYQTRNRLLFGIKYASFKTKVALIKQAIQQYLISDNPMQKKAIADFFKLRFGQMGL